MGEIGRSSGVQSGSKGHVLDGVSWAAEDLVIVIIAAHAMPTEDGGNAYCQRRHERHGRSGRYGAQLERQIRDC